MRVPQNQCLLIEDFLVVDQISKGPITEAFGLLPKAMGSIDARAQLLKTGLQESNFLHRRQISRDGRPTGPAAGYWQFEKGGIRGVMLHASTKNHLKVVCAELDVPFEVDAIWNLIQVDDVLAAALARLNYWWSSNQLPKYNDEQGSWDEYIWCWRPGKPHRHTWPEHHDLIVRYIERAYL